MIVPCIAPSWLYASGQQDAAGRAPFAEDLQRVERVAGPAELQAHQQHQAEAEEKEAERGEAVLHADPFVIGGEDVLADERLLMTGELVLLLFFLADADRFLEKLLRVIRVEPLGSYSELSSLSHVPPASVRSGVSGIGGRG